MNPFNSPSAAPKASHPRPRLWLALGLCLMASGGLTQETPDFAPRPAPNKPAAKDFQKQTETVMKAAADAKAQAERERQARVKAEDQARAQAQAQAREASASENKELKRKLAAEEARRKAAEATSEDNRRKVDAAAAAKKQAEQKVTEQLAAEQAKRQAVAEQAKRATEAAVRSIAPGTRLPAYPGGPVLIALETGSFNMGSANGEANERPVHSVRVAQSFAMGETELSLAQWDECANDTGNPLRCSYSTDRYKYWEGDMDHMPARLHLDEITEQYLPWLNAKTQAKAPYQFRLPTEAEWEYAARAGGTGDFSLGPNNSDEISSSNANYDAGVSYANSQKGAYRDRVVAVKSFKANAFGLFNMHGNVWEWTSDCYYSDEYERRKNSGEWLVSKTSKEEPGCKHVLRGGAFNSEPANLRSAYRNYNYLFTNFNYFLGLRLARTLQ